MIRTEVDNALVIVITLHKSPARRLASSCSKLCGGCCFQTGPCVQHVPPGHGPDSTYLRRVLAEASEGRPGLDLSSERVI
jgi:hypothetical protein